ERTASPAFNGLPLPRSGAAAPERRIKLCASGSMIGASPRPCTPNGSSELYAPAVGISRGTPFRSRSPGGTDAGPTTAGRNRWADNAHVVNGDETLVDFEVYGELIEWRAAAAEVAAP